MSRSTKRLAAAAVGAAAIATVLSACDKPTPKVTFQSGSTSTQATAQTYCYDVAHCRISTSNSVAALDAKGGSTVLVDVPRDIASNSWSVTAATLGTDGKYTQLDLDGTSSSTITDSHSTRLAVPYATGQYVLIVRETRAGKETGSWVARITVKS
jgi:hypothetical protein